MAEQVPVTEGLVPRIVHLFLTSKFPILMILISLSMGGAALLLTPREEEPQIVVPLADIYVNEKKISYAENMFIKYSITVSKYLKPGKNSIKVVFHSPLKMGIEKILKQNIPEVSSVESV